MSSENLGARFTNPPAESRILKIIHPWPDQSQAQDQLIRSLFGQGFGGVVCNVSFDDYLESESKWQVFKRAITEAKKAGMALWLYDEKGYPSGNAGGIVLRDHPEWEAHGLLIADAEFQSLSGVESNVTLALPPGKPILIAAFSRKEAQPPGGVQSRFSDTIFDLGRMVDLSAKVSDGKVSWKAPAGHWRLMAITEDRLFEGTHAQMNLWQKIPYINLLRPEPTARFLEVTHQRYADHLGNDLGQWFVSTFTDEPSLMSMFLRPMPYRVLPWSPSFPAEFKKRRGYALEPVVPALIAEFGPSGQRARYDYWLTIGELVSENFFGQIQSWCHSHNILSGGHLLAEEGILAHVPLYGDFFRCIRRLDAPSIDCLTSLPPDVPWFIARLLSSAAELDGKPVVMCETSDHSQRYRPPGDKRPTRSVTEAEIRGTCNRLIAGGVNVITSYYSFSDLSPEQLRRLNEWVGRCCTVLKGGHQVADVALLYPTESIWTRFRPARHWANDSPAAARIENIFKAAAESLFANQCDFTFIDSRALTEAKVESECLIHGNLRWRVVVLPGMDTLPLSAWESIARFVKSGGIAIALGALPTNSEQEFPSRRVQALAREIFCAGINGQPIVSTNRAGGAGIYLPFGSEGLLPKVLNSVVESELKASRAQSPLRVTHRRIEDNEVYFIINDSNQSWEGQATLPIVGRGEQLDPATGRISLLEDSQQIKLNLRAYGAMLLRFPKASPPRRHPIGSGLLPNLVLRALPETQPLLARGEFVRATIVRDDALTQTGQPAWKATGTLTKGQVDTFLFVRLPYPQLVDLSQADCLVVGTWVPEGQLTPAQILVILQEKGGGDFLADTGRSLGSAGYDQSFIPLNRFQLAGWAKDNDGVLDASRVCEIRIGWGGYLGSAEERIQFSLGIPRLGMTSMTNVSHRYHTK
jgi:hypothetical protein